MDTYACCVTGADDCLHADLQVLQLYVRLMVWLADTNPDFSVNENQWAAAALQHATMHHRVQVSAMARILATSHACTQAFHEKPTVHEACFFTRIKLAVCS